MPKPLKSGNRLDNRDWHQCMDTYGPSLSRCAGGRLVVDGFVCPHCTSSDPSIDCHRPSDEGRM